MCQRNINIRDHIYRKSNVPGLYSCVYFLYWALLKSEDNPEEVLSEETKLMWCSIFILEEIVEYLEKWSENKSQANSLRT